MSRRLLLILFCVFTLIAAIVIFPLRIAVDLAGLDRQGLAAASVWGSIWDGAFVDAQAGKLPLGTVATHYDPLSLFAGQARLHVQSKIGEGEVTARSGAIGLHKATGQISVNGAFDPLPIHALVLDAATIAFADGRCQQAGGRVRAVFSGNVGGLSLAQGMTGTPRCDGESVLLPLVSASTMERLTLRVRADGRINGDFLIRPGDPSVALKLSAAGFTLAQGGLVKRFEGSF